MNIWGGNILKRFSSSISRKMWSYLHNIKVVYCCRYFHLVNSVCICLIVSLIHLFLLLDVLVLFGSTTERCYEHLFFGALCSCMYAVNMSVSHTFYSVLIAFIMYLAYTGCPLSNNIVWYMISTRILKIEAKMAEKISFKDGHRYFGTCILQHECELSNALCIFVESLLYNQPILSSYL